MGGRLLDNGEPVRVTIRAAGIVGTLSYTVRTIQDVKRLMSADKQNGFEVIDVEPIRRLYSDQVISDIRRIRGKNESR